uniref:Radical SAM protein n=1 Tax=Geoglobus ahangari TaxID=113653 RepID=A0A7C4W349_9EURY
MLDYQTKAELIVLGVRTDLEPLRRGGGGPIGGISFRVKESTVSAPVKQWYVRNSPYHITEGYLYKLDKRIGKVELPKAEYYSHKVNGIPAGRIVALDGYDALVSAVSRRCIYWKDRRCIFCSIQENLKEAVVEKSAEIIAEVVKIAYEEDKNRHLTLTTGTVNPTDKGSLRLAEVTKIVKKEIDIPIHVQVEPVDRKYIEILYESGADTIGIHVETFDEKIRPHIIPAKPGIDEYIKCWENCVDIFGEWKVSSWLLIGLGESLKSVIEGFKKMAEKTVVPFIAPFRPSPSSMLNRPDPNYVKKVYSEILRLDRDINLKKFSAGCPRCNGCSAIGELFL